MKIFLNRATQIIVARFFQRGGVKKKKKKMKKTSKRDKLSHPSHKIIKKVLIKKSSSFVLVGERKTNTVRKAEKLQKKY